MLCGVFLTCFLSGSETELSGATPSVWVTEQRKKAMKTRLGNMKLIIDHIIEHMNEAQINADLLKEMIGEQCPFNALLFV
jgi:cytochrome c556